MPKLCCKHVQPRHVSASPIIKTNALHEKSEPEPLKMRGRRYIHSHKNTNGNRRKSNGKKVHLHHYHHHDRPPTTTFAPPPLAPKLRSPASLLNGELLRVLPQVGRALRGPREADGAQAKGRRVAGGGCGAGCRCKGGGRRGLGGCDNRATAAGRGVQGGVFPRWVRGEGKFRGGGGGGGKCKAKKEWRVGGGGRGEGESQYKGREGTEGER